ncbi:oxygenase MpaB family protein [Streptomyces sp. S465]|uniref:oxygenase MpaB family protein n=1 Tax=Streptomyces sp. S465 TaxID=2979468 RepID=UPI0022A8532C|nr:oxygenase MpaB family protein [Streptomyces sp. S465]WAP59217.1 oxygenase MpaB family protein [Streptomyces sp. S465]
MSTQSPRATTEGHDPPPPGGILWAIAGELRSVLALPAAMTMQVAHPAVGAGVDRYSVFRTDPWGRGERSLRSVQLWVYGGAEAETEGRRLRGLHASIQGVDAHGRPYRALDPPVYAWVHATGYPVYLRAQRYLGTRPFTAAEERQLYGEWLRIGRVLGIDNRAMPGSVEEFWPYYRAMVRERLEPTVVARELTAPDASVPPPGPLPPRLLWPLLRPLFTRFRAFLTVGLMPPDAREAIGLEWTPGQERRLRWFGRGVRVVVPLLPERLRYLPIAREARRRARAGRRWQRGRRRWRRWRRWRMGPKTGHRA